MLLTLVFARHRRLRGVTLTATLRHPASLRPSPQFPLRAFDRFDETLYLVEEASDLTLTDLARRRASIRCYIRVAMSCFRFLVNLRGLKLSKCFLRQQLNLELDVCKPSPHFSCEIFC
jgi:hypothetical protein